MKKYTVCVIGGDGIGPEVTGESVRMLTALHVPLIFTYANAGFGAYQKYGDSLPNETIDMCRNADAILFGAVTTPPHIKGYNSPIIVLRRVLDLYANVRPVTSVPLNQFRQNIDLVIVRENTEDLYVGRERVTEKGAIAERVITRKASERIADYAFCLARRMKKRKVTVVHKANVLRITDGLFLNVCQAVGKKYPDIATEDMLVDSCAMRLIKSPEEFDVIVTTNMFGDILSDEASALIGGLGIAPSANIGRHQGLFEPVHGSAPKYVGTGTANPSASFLAACMMLDHLGMQKAADAIRLGLNGLFNKRIMTADLGGKCSMKEFTDEVIKIVSL